jgi:hypothetical protein
VPEVLVHAEPTPWRVRASQSRGKDEPKAKSSVDRNMITNPMNIGMV